MIGTSLFPSQTLLAEGDGKGGGGKLGLLLHFTSDKARLSVLDLPVVLSTRVPDKTENLGTQKTWYNMKGQKIMYLLENTTDIRACVEGATDQD